MKDNLIIGRYIPGNSIMHRFDPRLKLVGLIVMMLLVFAATTLTTNVIMIVAVTSLVLMSGISLGVFLKGLRPMIAIIIFTVALQILFTHTGDVIWSWGFLALTTGGLMNAAYIFVRFLLIIFLSTILTLTTQPLAITDAMESLLKPVKNIIPVHEIALMLSIALRFVPTLLEEAEKIMNAQRARGVDFSEGNIIQRVKAFIPVLIPLFISAFNRAYDLATAMEARGYRGGEGRSKYRLLHWENIDTIGAIVLAILTVVMIVL
ncbi:energy-coupling factor transporter transmembrane protein EcfT [Aerococcus sp. 1KP-2016]|jgi:energy-coupling factor transport system permease protein|uniref:energy-coupling factor transporter transmembrane component T family protein n=1 Tax=Aerococcus sp. 1KP-2016 TaxID=1981982 RepID=UPI000B97F430|nr:energy-coupling factor transporter transmembrane component T [Aerococcus sp. 1KP-2016]OYQ68113.1 cobalt ABC transporter ATP-binding protein [Aerococcus sp. 1KP-2016]